MSNQVDIRVKQLWSQPGTAKGYLLVADSAESFIGISDSFFENPDLRGNEPAIPIILDEMGMTFAVKNSGNSVNKYAQLWTGFITGGAKVHLGRGRASHFEITARGIVESDVGFIAALIKRRRISDAKKAELMSMSGKFGQVVLGRKLVTIEVTNEMPSISDKIGVNSA